ncbi:uncharacterized protein CMC5_010630 [Chondromyces crocatus]|uniref:Uncharacterized protein n=1 Tax=Chondromyces crocatus TaxID=52 RepID=A0A0K1E8C0_CHOCO|nr:uncharacterized protein CMC5_010630 [Chondromyces crocatus]
MVVVNLPADTRQGVVDTDLRQVGAIHSRAAMARLVVVSPSKMLMGSHRSRALTLTRPRKVVMGCRKAGMAHLHNRKAGMVHLHNRKVVMGRRRSRVAMAHLHNRKVVMGRLRSRVAMARHHSHRAATERPRPRGGDSRSSLLAMDSTLPRAAVMALRRARSSSRGTVLPPM